MYEALLITLYDNPKLIEIGRNKTRQEHRLLSYGELQKATVELQNLNTSQIKANIEKDFNLELEAIKKDGRQW